MENVKKDVNQTPFHGSAAPSSQGQNLHTKRPDQSFSVARPGVEGGAAKNTRDEDRGMSTNRSEQAQSDTQGSDKYSQSSTQATNMSDTPDLTNTSRDLSGTGGSSRQPSRAADPSGERSDQDSKDFHQREQKRAS